MIFDRIIIENLFSYYGKQVFDLTGVSNDRNIVLIYGRNGHGKTNFLNSLKLLFTGSNDPTLRQLGSPHSPYSKSKSTVLSASKFVNGAMPFWEGIRNRQAVIKGLEDYAVTIEWHEGEKSITACRSWPLQSRVPAGELKIKMGGKSLRENEAEAFLANRLPSELVPYFHFDGELIRDLAEASESHSMTFQIERLLDLRRILDLKEQCQIVLKDFRKQYASEEHIQKELELEADKSRILAKRNKCDNERNELHESLQEIESRLERLNRELDSIFETGSLNDEEALRVQQQAAKERLDEACQRFITASTFDLPLCVNPDLSRRVINRLSDMQQDESKEQKYLIEKLKRVLPDELFGLPPYPTPRLTASQEKFFIEKTKKLFEKMSDGLQDKGLWTIGIERIDELLDDFTSAFSDAKNRQAQAAEILRQIGREKKLLNEIEDKLIEASGLSQRARERYDNLKNERSNLELEKGSILKTIKDNTNEIERYDQELAQLDKELKKVSNAIEIASRGKRKVDLLADTIRALDAYRAYMRDLYRDDIQKRVNDYFHQILDSFDLIGQIKLNDDFIPEYYDSSDRLIGRLSVSAGTKQLLATAFLWALKEVSERTVPVVVDTPLARIDKRHQENLLTRFYPRVSQQVIILPTDSELDSNKYSLIKGHVYREYKLENPTGIATKVSSNHMYKSD